jgi:hypothetical protein
MGCFTTAHLHLSPDVDHWLLRVFPQVWTERAFSTIEYNSRSSRHLDVTIERLLLVCTVSNHVLLHFTNTSSVLLLDEASRLPPSAPHDVRFSLSVSPCIRKRYALKLLRAKSLWYSSCG